MNLFDTFLGESFALQTDRIDSVASSMIAYTFCVRKWILDDNGITADKSMLSSAAKLMHSGICADAGVVFNRNVTCKGCRVRHDDSIAQVTVVRNMSLRHKETVASHCGHSTAACGPAIDRNKLAEDISLADHNARRLAFKLQI